MGGCRGCRAPTGSGPIPRSWGVVFTGRGADGCQAMPWGPGAPLGAAEAPSCPPPGAPHRGSGAGGIFGRAVGRWDRQDRALVSPGTGSATASAPCPCAHNASGPVGAFSCPVLQDPKQNGLLGAQATAMGSCPGHVRAQVPGDVLGPVGSPGCTRSRGSWGTPWEWDLTPNPAIQTQTVPWCPSQVPVPIPPGAFGMAPLGTQPRGSINISKPSRSAGGAKMLLHARGRPVGTRQATSPRPCVTRGRVSPSPAVTAPRCLRPRSVPGLGAVARGSAAGAELCA